VDTGKSVGNQAVEGAQTLMNKTREVSQQASNITQQATTAAQQATTAAQQATTAAQQRPTVGGYRLSRKQRNKNKWKTLRKTPKK